MLTAEGAGRRKDDVFSSRPAPEATYQGGA
jgi:hypothetical protein